MPPETGAFALRDWHDCGAVPECVVASGVSGAALGDVDLQKEPKKPPKL